MLLPRVFHQVWLGADPFPEVYAGYQQTWLDKHPGWELRFWTEENLPEGLRRPEAAERLRSPAERADILRLELVWRFGGVYVDTDFECRRSIEPLIEDADFFVVLERSGGPSNALFGSVATNPILDRALEQIRAREVPGYDEAATGPKFLENVLSGESGVTFLDSKGFYPRTSAEVEEAYAVCHAVRLRKGPAEAWKALVKGEKRLQEAQKQIRYWRRKYEEAEAQLPAGESVEEPPPERRAPERAMKIPRIFHQVWVGTDPLPEEHLAYQRTWLDHHPGWELRFWTDENLPDGLRRPEGADRLRLPGERCDFLRVELLWRFGGVYVDTDFECLRSIEPLIADADLFIGMWAPGRVNGAVLGAIAGHPVLDRALDELEPREFYGYQMEAGPKFLDRFLSAYRDQVLFLEPEVLYAATPEAEKAYAFHHSARTWKDAELLRIDLERAQQKADHRNELALADARRWRARCKEAEEELDRLKRTLLYRLSRLPRVVRGAWNA